MQSIIREKIVIQLTLMSELVNLYSQQDSQFSTRAFHWLQASETALEPFRLPLVSQLSSLRGLMSATEDGYIDPGITTGKSRSQRKQKRATIMMLLQQAESVLREKAQSIDESFNEYRDKLSQLLALASAKAPLPAQESISTEYLDRIWQMAKDAQDNPTLSFYLQSRLTDTDRRYLLRDLIVQLLASKKIASP